jgi:hypothetical protein
MNKENRITNFPKPIFFIEDEDGLVSVSINDFFCPDKDEIEKCIKALQDFSADWTQESIDKFNAEVLVSQSEHRSKRISPIQETKKESGFIYVIETCGVYKIGRAKTKSRIQTYRTENPNDINLLLLHATIDYKNTEKEILKKYADNVYRGKEWMKLNKKQLKLLIKDIKSYE